MTDNLPRTVDGAVKPGPGRHKGSKNKFKPRTTEHLVAELDKYKFDVVAEIVLLYRDDHTSAGTKHRILELLAKLIYPALRSSEVNAVTFDDRHLTISWGGTTQDAPAIDDGDDDYDLDDEDDAPAVRIVYPPSEV